MCQRIEFEAAPRKDDPEHFKQLRHAPACVVGRIRVHHLDEVDEHRQECVGNRRFAGMRAQIGTVAKYMLDEFDLMSRKLIVVERSGNDGQGAVGKREGKTDK